MVFSSLRCRLAVAFHILFLIFVILIFFLFRFISLLFFFSFRRSLFFINHFFWWFIYRLVLNLGLGEDGQKLLFLLLNHILSSISLPGICKLFICHACGIGSSEIAERDWSAWNDDLLLAALWWVIFRILLIILIKDRVKRHFIWMADSRILVLMIAFTISVDLWTHDILYSLNRLMFKSRSS